MIVLLRKCANNVSGQAKVTPRKCSKVLSNTENCFDTTSSCMFTAQRPNKVIKNKIEVCSGTVSVYILRGLTQQWLTQDWLVKISLVDICRSFFLCFVFTIIKNESIRSENGRGGGVLVLCLIWAAHLCLMAQSASKKRTPLQTARVLSERFSTLHPFISTCTRSPGDLPGDLAEWIPPLWLSLGGSSSRVILGFGLYSFLGLLETSFILSQCSNNQHVNKPYLWTTILGVGWEKVLSTSMPLLILLIIPISNQCLEWLLSSFFEGGKYFYTVL